MKIKLANNRYHLYDGQREIKLQNLIVLNNDSPDPKLVGVSSLYKDLLGLELGPYEQIIGKTFDRPTEGANSTTQISEDFYKFVEIKKQ